MTQREGNFIWLSALILCIASFFSDGHYHADEHHQILEFAAVKLGTNQVENLAWEYEARMRPSIQPSMVVATHYLLKPLGLDDPFRVIRILRLLSALLSLWAMALIYFAYRDSIDNRQFRNWFLGLSFFLWVLLYQSVRFSAENWSATLFVIGFVHFLTHRKGGFKHHFIWGVWMGAAFVFRFQTGFLILGFLGWLLFQNKSSFKNISGYAAGGLGMSALGVLVDRVFYGEWVFTPYSYFEQNILLDKASNFGVEPWWYYITSTIELGVPPFSVFFILAVILGVFFYRRSPLAWVLIPYVFVHLVIGHKEVRFFFPFIVFLPILMIRSLAFIQEELSPNLMRKRWILITTKIFWAMNVILVIIISFKPADHDVALWEKVYDTYKDPITIYYNHRSPYGFLLQHNYFKPKGVRVEKVSDLSSLANKTETIVFYTRERTILKEHGIHGNLLFKTFPEWVRNFNFNGWLDRTKQDYLYEITPAK